jgi:hypothetical protein
MTESNDEPRFGFTPESEGRRWLPEWLSTTVLWGLLGLLGWLVFEWTAHAELSLVVICLKFGLHDWANGWWLWRRDPDRKRGLIHALAYATLGLWWITVMSFLLTGLLAVAIAVTDIFLGPGAPADRGAWAILATVAVFFAASVAGGLTTLGVTLLAYGLGVRVWLSLGVSPWRRRDEFPPIPDQPNLIGRLFETSLLVAVTGMVNLTLVLWLVEPLRFLVIPGVLMSVATMVAVVYRDPIKIRVSSVSPEECWGSARPMPVEGAGFDAGPGDEVESD